jgi:hypothetical protein
MLAATENAYRQAYPDRTDVLPSKALFQHVHDARDFAIRVAASNIFPHQIAAGEVKLREIAETNLARLKPNWNAHERRESAIYIAGGFIGLLRWWMQSGVKQSPEQMQAAFERITKSVLEG